MVRVSNYSRDACLNFGRDRIEYRRARAGHPATVPDREAAQRVQGRPGDPRLNTVRPTSCSTATVPRGRAGLARVAEKFVGGLRLTADRTGDCRMFTWRWPTAPPTGVAFRYGKTIERHRSRERTRRLGVETDRPPETADAYVCAWGAMRRSC